jgi:Terminase large subunit, T4likevirus-type, N-terminal
MRSIRDDLAVYLDPVRLARRAGFDPDSWQAGVLRSSKRQQILLAARQSGKSTTSAMLAVREILASPPALVLLLAPALRQSQELFKKCKGLLDALGDLVPPIVQESALSLELANGSRVISLPGADDARIRGYSNVALLVVDEAARVEDELWFAAKPMLAVSQGKVVLLSTPHGMTGFFHQVWTEGGDTWERVKVTADQCPRISADFLSQEREAMPDYVYRQEYGVEFLANGTAIFTPELIASAITDEVKPMFNQPFWKAA